MEFVPEVTAFLENKPGRLAKICSALAQEKIDIRALSVMETDGPSVLRFITSELEQTKNVLLQLAGNRIPDRRGIGGPDGKPHRLTGQGAGTACCRKYQCRIRLRIDTGCSAQGAGDLPHIEPQARQSNTK